MSFIVRIRAKSQERATITLIKISWILLKIKRWRNIQSKKSDRNCANKFTKHPMEWEIIENWQPNLSSKKIRIWRPNSKL